MTIATAFIRVARSALVWVYRATTKDLKFDGFVENLHSINSGKQSKTTG